MITIGVTQGITVELQRVSNHRCIVVIHDSRTRIGLTLAQAQEVAELLCEAVAQAPELTE